MQRRKRGNNYLGAVRMAVAAAGLVVASLPASAQSTLYVRVTGGDRNSCTASQPCATILRASSLAKPGDTVLVGPGTYTGSFQTRTSGTSAAYITYRSAEKWGAKIVQGPSGSVWGNYGDFVAIDGFEIIGNASSSGVNGIFTSGDYTLVEHNKVHGILPSTCKSNGGAGIHLESMHDQIIGNYIYEIGPQPGSPLFPCSYVHGIYFEKPFGLAAENVVFLASGYGIHEWHRASNLVVVNNTIFNNGFGGILVGNDGKGNPTVNNQSAVVNNVVYGNGKYGIHECCTAAFTGTCNLYDNNLVYRNPTNILLQTSSEKTTIIADPLFVRYTGDAAGDYHLQATSPGINRGLKSDENMDCGTKADFPAYDFDGKARTISSGKPSFDLGAYESAVSRNIEAAESGHPQR